MSKRFDIKFENQDEFLKKHPHFSINKPTPNYAAIRAVLRSGNAIEGVSLVEVKNDAPEPERKPTLGEIVHTGKHKKD